MRTDQDYANPNFSIPVPVQQDSFVPSPEVSQPFIKGPPPRPPAPKVRRPSSARSSPSFQNSPANGSMLKNEPSNDNQDSVSSFSNSEDSPSVPAFQPPNIPPTVHLTHTQTGTPFNISSDNGTEFTNTEPSETAQAGDSNNDSTIKLEPVGEGELDLEITGVELGSGAEGFQGDWGQDTSGGQDMLGFPQSESGDSSLNQSGSQYSK